MHATTVGVRLRPFSPLELQTGKRQAVLIHNDGTVYANGQKFTFNPRMIFDDSASENPAVPTEQLYARLVAPVVESSLRGLPSTVLAYGQTGAGKSYTMVGSDQHPGIQDLAARHIFRCLHWSDAKAWKVSLACFELQNESLTDLLATPLSAKRCGVIKKKAVVVRCDEASRGTVHGLIFTDVASAAEAEILMHTAARLRITRAAQMCTTSSSHMFVRFSIQRCTQAPSELTMITLSGSDRPNGAQTLGLSSQKSLSVLSRCVKSVLSESPAPMRRSLLTMIMHASLRSAGRTAVIATLNPSNGADSRNTLAFVSDMLRLRFGFEWCEDYHQETSFQFRQWVVALLVTIITAHHLPFDMWESVVAQAALRF
eukprot:TRINITY_DN33957_c0_g1_i1.p1 TRINITY_DN33957_c0_g1~~TRINITY_DN33957_c0_g1_i1.p1  ORF type:complete len:371 (+),score=56.45 TRINITY_DN33957_c0_g1_i1:163-1275(+)